MSLFPSTGGASYSEKSKKVIRLILKGCVNRPFFHISVMEKKKEPDEQVIEQIGNYDPLPNKYNEKLFAINFKRLEYWLQNDVKITTPVLKLLGLSGYFPIHPETFEMAWRNRIRISNELKRLKIKAAEITSDLESTSNASLKSSSELTETVLASSTESLSASEESVQPESSASTETVSTDSAESLNIKKPEAELSSDISDSSKSPDDPSSHSKEKS